MKFGLEVFPNCVEFWLTLIDQLIDSKNYPEAYSVIDSSILQINEQSS